MGDNQDQPGSGEFARLLHPRPIYVINAHKRAIWSVSAADHFKQFGFLEEVRLVNQNGGTIHGQKARRTASPCTACETEIGSFQVTVAINGMLIPPEPAGSAEIFVGTPPVDRARANPRHCNHRRCRHCARARSHVHGTQRASCHRHERGSVRYTHCAGMKQC